jgi:hypothetical protein
VRRNKITYCRFWMRIKDNMAAARAVRLLSCVAQGCKMSRDGGRKAVNKERWWNRLGYL